MYRDFHRLIPVDQIYIIYPCTVYKESPETHYDVFGYGSGTANWTNTSVDFDMYDIQLQIQENICPWSC